MLDARTLGGELAAMVKAQFSPVLDRLEQRMAAFEKRLDAMPTPRDGKDADPAAVASLAAKELRGDIEAVKALIPQHDVAAMVKEAVAEAVAAIPMPQDGKDADPAEVVEMAVQAVRSEIDAAKAPAGPSAEEVAGMVAAAVEKAVAEIPPAKDGKDADAEAIAALVSENMREEIEAAVKALPEPEKLPDVEAMVKAAVAAIPVPEAPKLPDVDAIVADAVDRAVKALPPAPAGASGVGVAGALIDREGNLVVTLSNGEAKTLGAVVGRDGHGKDGADGLGFDDMKMDFDGERTFTFRFERGEKVVERKFTAPVVLDRGVFRAGAGYEKGDAVTYGGSVWIAQGETSEKPGSGAGWRLAVKAGRDGRDGVVKAAPEAKSIKLRGGRDAD